MYKLNNIQTANVWWCLKLQYASIKVGSIFENIIFYTGWSTLVSSHLIEAINKSTKVDLSESWMNELARILKSALKMMRSIHDGSSISDILAMENKAWEHVCRAIPWEVTTFYRLKWQVQDSFWGLVCLVKNTYIPNNNIIYLYLNNGYKMKAKILI